MKKYLLLLLLLPLTFYGQVIITKPVDNQLVARVPSDNDQGVVSFQGEVDKGGTERNYDQIQIWVFRSGAPYPNSLSYKHKKTLSYKGDIAKFTYNNIKIKSEKRQYSFKVYGRENGNLYKIKTINDVVSGDVYIIQGQSNAVAQRRADGGSSSSQENKYIRVYGSGTDNFNTLLTQDSWYEGVGDASKAQPGNVGQWGIKLARMMLDEFGYPIAIFNGARGASAIPYFQKDYQEWESGDSGPKFLPNGKMNNNFGRLYYRLERTNLMDNVRAVLWSQGERTGSFYPTNIYKKYFLELKADWESNYPSIEMFYIFQTRYCQGCDILPFSNPPKPAYFAEILETKEAQRQLAIGNNDIQIMPTNALNVSYFDGNGWHFKYLGGYEYFATRIFELVSRDIYGVSKSNDINAPNITKATLSGNTLTLETDANSLSMDAGTDKGDFILGRAGPSTITNVNVSGSNVILTLSASPDKNATISYTAQRVDGRPPTFPPANFIKNSKGIELLCFNEYPIIDSVNIPDNSGEEIVYDFEICKGESVTLKAPDGGDKYTWNNGQTGKSITVSPTKWTKIVARVSTNGIVVRYPYKVDVVSKCSETSTGDSDNDSNNIGGEVVFDFEICRGESVTLIAPDGGDKYTWNNGQTGKIITVSPTEWTKIVARVSTNGTVVRYPYKIDVIGDCSNTEPEGTAPVEECSVVANAGKNVTINKGESVTLTASGGDTYLWTTGETSKSIGVRPSSDTRYKVTVTANGCSDRDGVSVTVVSTTSKNAIDKKDRMKESELSHILKVYPNPSSGNITVNVPRYDHNDLNLVLISLNGIVVYQTKMKSNGNVISKELDLSRLKKGAYFIKIFNNDLNIVETILLN